MRRMLTLSERLWQSERLERIRRWDDRHDYEEFIDSDHIETLLASHSHSEQKAVEAIIQKARQNATTGALLDPGDVAVLANVQDPQLWQAIFETANWIKQTVYGNRIVLFAPLYVSSLCVNNCAYCGFRSSNAEVRKHALTTDELRDELHALVNVGHKRLIMVYGEHPGSDYEYICKTIETAYETKGGHGEIRRVNVNAAPLFVEEYKAVRSVGIGTYQVFQETYHRPTYRKLHSKGTLKAEYNWRLFALHRAQQAGIDDVAVGVLFGLYDWRAELLGLLYHAMSLEKHFGVGPHTISYPRLEPAVNTPLATASPHRVSDEEFSKIVAIIRLMCPYTGSILTARERPVVRREVMRKGGVSQMDAGSRIAVGGYSHAEREHLPDRQQFMLADTRSLDELIGDICKDGYLPSFCTAGYREGRTGPNFMPLAKHATVKNFCIANGILTFEEYLADFASESVRSLGRDVIIPRYLRWVDSHLPSLAAQVRGNLDRMRKESQRDLRF
jgi:2-iminoacetate synthase